MRTLAFALIGLLGASSPLAAKDNPPQGKPPQYLIPQQDGTALNPRTGERYAPAAGGAVFDPRTGKHYQDVGPVYFDPQTGRYIQKQ